MDYPKSVPSAGLVNGKFVDENPLTGTPGSLIPANWGNGVTEEIVSVIKAGDLTPDEGNNTQLLAAIKTVAASDGITPGRLIGIRVFTSNGTYSATKGTQSVVVEMVGGGGAGGSSAATSSTQVASASGGFAGSYAKGRFSSGFNSVAVTIGAGGAAASAGANSGGTGGTSSFGSLMSAPGGIGGIGATPVTAPWLGASSNVGPGVPPFGANIVGFAGEPGGYGVALAGGCAGAGGSGPFGSGGHSPVAGGGRSGSGYGAGSSGSNTPPGYAAGASVNGCPGIVIVYEYA
jgi:hypothetical protein